MGAPTPPSLTRVFHELLYVMLYQLSTFSRLLLICWKRCNVTLRSSNQSELKELSNLRINVIPSNAQLDSNALQILPRILQLVHGDLPV
jgi:hypothetical protein